jgi:hypothetical protein
MVGQELVIPGNGVAAFGGVSDVRARGRDWPTVLPTPEGRGAAEPAPGKAGAGAGAGV